ncbi:hypothetical protein [Halostagnicola bangensis]
MLGTIDRAYEKLQNDGSIPLLHSVANHLQDAGRMYARDTYQRVRFRARYGSAAPEPYRLIHVDPATVEHILSPRFYSNIGTYGTYVLGGDWDIARVDDYLPFYEDVEAVYGHRAVFRLENYELYRLLVERFENHTPWEETEFYARYASLAEEERWDSQRYGPENIHERFRYLDDLYERMSDGGYRTQRELVSDPTGLKPPEVDEVILCIGRDGTLIQGGAGQHRLMLSKILDIRRIPVRVFVRHEKWQRLRKKVADHDASERSAEIERYSSHPDVRHLNGSCSDGL